MSRDDERSAESRRIINRVGAETEASMMKRAKDHMSGRDADEKDWAELWGTRIGRWLGVVVLGYFVFWLISSVVNNG